MEDEKIGRWGGDREVGIRGGKRIKGGKMRMLVRDGLDGDLIRVYGWFWCEEKWMPFRRL